MGMFDEIIIDFKLPEMMKDPPYHLQTKNLDCNFNTYTILNSKKLVLLFETGTKKTLNTEILFDGVMDAIEVDLNHCYLYYKLYFHKGILKNIEMYNRWHGFVDSDDYPVKI